MSIEEIDTEWKRTTEMLMNVNALVLAGLDKNGTSKEAKYAIITGALIAMKVMEQDFRELLELLLKDAGDVPSIDSVVESGVQEVRSRVPKWIQP